MQKITAITLSIGVLLPLISFAQESPYVPALPGANPSQVQPQSNQTPAELIRQMQEKKSEAQQQVERIKSRIPNTEGANAPNAGSETVKQPAVAVPIPQVIPSTTSTVLLPSKKSIGNKPNIPLTDNEIASLEKKLSDAKTKRKINKAIDSGTFHAERASYVRAKVVFPYYEKSIFEIYTSVNRMTTIELQPGEVITTENQKPKAADTVQWMVDTVSSGEANNKIVNILIKPTQENIETNMIIPTNKRSYYIILRSDSQSYMPIVGFNYPFDEAQSKALEIKAKEVEENKFEDVSISPDKLRFGYNIKGAKVEWRPLRVFDNGMKTFIQMSPLVKSYETPALFIMEDGQPPLLVNFRIKGDYYIVDRLFTKAQLRIDSKNVDINRDSRANNTQSNDSWLTGNI